MEVKIKNRLETLINIRNRMYDSALSHEVDIILFNRELLSPTVIDDDQIQTIKQQLAAREAQVEVIEKIVPIVDELIKKEIKSKNKGVKS